ncbi:hypothetical protein AY599_21245 [Leptolyngbya valderiana BDU 20041]|nr:hypothetical protein AY599_21245 [Leptolyngbya valderiana BDU 20041]
MQAQEREIEMSERVLLLDDFESADGISALGTAWQGFTDRVMGGRSDMQAGYREDDGKPVLFMRGEVRLENNGGFVQLRLPLDDRGSFDASDWDAIRLTVRASPGPYFVHLRTRDTRRPWAYYRAPIPVSDNWRTVDIPFEAFERESLRAPLDLASLLSLGIVAYGERFDAALELARVELVKK